MIIAQTFPFEIFNLKQISEFRLEIRLSTIIYNKLYDVKIKVFDFLFFVQVSNRPPREYKQIPFYYYTFQAFLKCAPGIDKQTTKCYNVRIANGAASFSNFITIEI